MAVLLIALTIIFKQRFIKLLPCLVSLFVYYFDSKVNRYAKLLGAANSIIYSIGYFIDGLYGSVGSALLYSLPLQLITFFLWNKHKYKQGTKLRLINNYLRILSIVVVFLVAGVYILIFKNISGSNYLILQGFQFGIGFVATILVMFGCVEGPFINLFNIGISVYLYIDFIVRGQTNQITYLAMVIYTFVYAIIGIKNWIKMYQEQQRINEEIP